MEHPATPLDPGPRLRAVASLVPAGSWVVDVGSDHGRLAAYLISRGVSPRCIATERTRRQADALRRRWEGLAPGLIVRCGDGLSALEPHDGPDTAILAGMGGRKILDLLDRAGNAGITRVILQPQRNTGLVRRGLAARRFVIDGETVAVDRGRPYFVLRAVRRESPPRYTHPVLSADDVLEVGPVLVGSADPAVRAYWLGRRRLLRAAMAEAAAGAGLRRVARELARVERILPALGTPCSGAADAPDLL